MNFSVDSRPGQPGKPAVNYLIFLKWNIKLISRLFHLIVRSKCFKKFKLKAASNYPGHLLWPAVDGHKLEYFPFFAATCNSLFHCKLAATCDSSERALIRYEKTTQLLAHTRRQSCCWLKNGLAYRQSLCARSDDCPMIEYANFHN